MLQGFTLILVFQLIGELLVGLVDLPVPGPVIGMVLLFIALMLRGASAGTEQSATALLQHMSLLFIPAGVGVVLFLPVLAAEWPAISVSLLVGTLLTVAITGVVMSLLLRRSAAMESDHE